MSGHPSQGSINLRDFLQLKYQVNNRELIAKKAITPLISIVDDDGNAQFVEKYEDIIRTKNVPITCAFVTSRVDLEFYLSTTQVNYCINELGVEFISHTHTHPSLVTLTEEEIRQEFENSQAILSRFGCYAGAEILAYPGGAQNKTVRRIARDYFRCALGDAGASNPVHVPPLQTFNIMRYNITDDASGKTYEQIKTYIDEAIIKNGWLIMTTHSQNTSFTESFKQVLKDIIDYARNQGAEFINIANGLAKYGNVLVVGDTYDANYLIVGSDGSINSSFGIEKNKDKYSFYTPITEFPINQVTVAWIGALTAPSFPHSSPGILTTYRFGENTTDRQEFRPKAYNEIWVRHVKSDGSWGYFLPLTPIAGPTSGRPNDNYIGCRYFDTDLWKDINVKVAGVREVNTLTLTSGATLQSGNIIIGSVTVAVTEGMTIAEVDAAIRTISMAGWKISGTLGTGVIIFTRLASTVTATLIFADTDSTGVTGTVEKTQTGVATVWIDKDGTTV